VNLFAKGRGISITYAGAGKKGRLMKRKEKKRKEKKRKEKKRKEKKRTRFEVVLSTSSTRPITFQPSELHVSR
jgi:hypothetical protein